MESLYAKKKYAKEILKKFCIGGLQKYYHYNSLTGFLMYLIVTRPDIMFVFMHCASEVHLQAVKRIMKYVKFSTDYVSNALTFNFQFHGYSNEWVV
ncbi:hypothetical protein CR513_62746, partial [Mucuna pruriens]